MKNLKQLYKKEIKKNSALLKELNPLSRKLESLSSKRQWDTPEYIKLSERRKELTFNHHHWYIKKETRHLLLGYAMIRNKDLLKVEKNYPNGVDLVFLEKLMKKMLESELITQEVENE